MINVIITGPKIYDQCFLSLTPEQKNLLDLLERKGLLPHTNIQILSMEDFETA